MCIQLLDKIKTTTFWMKLFLIWPAARITKRATIFEYLKLEEESRMTRTKTILWGTWALFKNSMELYDNLSSEWGTWALFKNSMELYDNLSSYCYSLNLDKCCYLLCLIRFNTNPTASRQTILSVVLRRCRRPRIVKKAE